MCETAAVHLAQRLRGLDDRVLHVRTKPFAIPGSYGYLPWQRWTYTVVAIVWVASASVSRETLQVLAASLWGIAAVVAWTRPLSEITAAGITWRVRPFSRHHVSWSQVAAVQPGTGLRVWSVELRLTDGSSVVLPGIPQDHIPALRRRLTEAIEPRTLQ